MSLTCTCPDDCEWYYTVPLDFTKLNTMRRRRCSSCNNLIDKETTVLAFERFRYSRDDVENRIFGDDTEIPMASKYLCEACGNLYFNLDALGFCVNPDDNMVELIKEYHEIYDVPVLGKQP